MSVIKTYREEGEDIGRGVCVCVCVCVCITSCEHGEAILTNPHYCEPHT